MAVSINHLNNLRTSITIYLMPRSTVICVLLLVGTAIPSTARTKMPPVLAACSAFAPDGTSAMATIMGDTLELTVAEVSAQNSKLTLPLKHRAQQSQLDNPADRWRVYNCSLFFNSTSGLVAVGITTESEPPQRLQVAVADFRTAKWLSDFDVEPRKELGSRTQTQLSSFETGILQKANPLQHFCSAHVESNSRLRLQFGRCRKLPYPFTQTPITIGSGYSTAP
jgi:hypothetical protein